MNQAHFEKVYHEHRDAVFRFCYRLCGDRDEAEDLAQEVFLRAYRGLEKYEGRAAVKTWLFRIVRNAYLTRSSRVRETEALELLDERDAPVAGPASRLVERLSLENAMAQLSEPVREAIILVHCEGLKFREAAEVLQVPQGTVATRVRDGTARLRRLLQEQGALPAFFPGWWLATELRRWSDVRAPASLTERILREIAEANRGADTAGAVEGVERIAARTDQTGRCPRIQRPAGVVVGAAAVVLCLGAGYLYRSGHLAPRARVATQMLWLAEPRTAFASGTRVDYPAPGAELNASPQRLAVEYWYQAPGRYVRRTRPEGGGAARAMELRVNGSEGMASRGQSPALPVSTTDVREALAPFAVADPNGALQEALRSREAQVSVVHAEAGGEGMQLFQVTVTENGRREQWELMVSEETKLPSRVEYRVSTLRSGRATPAYLVVLERLEHNRPLPEGIF